MATTLHIEYEGREYALRYTADALKRLERKGFNFNNLGDKLLTAPEELFCMLFEADYSVVSRSKRLEIFRELCNEDEDGQTLFDAMASMLSEAVDEITNPKGKLRWTLEK